jgi:hypothetical protein
MYNINILDYTHKIINDFIIWYRKVFLELFDDTWIENEKLIRETYIKTSKEFKNKIYKSLNLILEKDIILWQTHKDDENFMVTIPVNNFRLFVYYRENKKIRERYIENIEFYKK